MKLYTIKVFFRDAVNNIRRNSVMSVASILSVVSALVIVGVVLSLAININYLTDNIEANLQLKVYLEDSIPSVVQEEVYKGLLSCEGVGDVEYQSKAEALQSFRATLGEKNASIISSYTEENSPLPAAFIVTFEDASFIETAYLKAVEMEGVKDAVYGEETVRRLLKFNAFINTVTWVMFAILSLIAVFIIFNTIKLTVFSRRNEISIMKYVGATDWYIRCPFLIEGTLLGVCGSLFSILLLRNLYYYVVGLIAGSAAVLPFGTSLAPASMVLREISLIFLVYGILLGAVGSSFSIKKFLKV
ncbi:MAG: permease-like cell division protein FtsX [Eubacteriaceae bacterium]|nr:permease-like cell division protein FtsX [Eubacteriaceae bacterium]